MIFAIQDLLNSVWSPLESACLSTLPQGQSPTGWTGFLVEVIIVVVTPGGCVGGGVGGAEPSAGTSC